MRHAGGRREYMRTRLGLAILDAYPGLKARDAVALAAKFFGRLTIDQMKAKILNAGGYNAAGILAVDVHGAPEGEGFCKAAPSSISRWQNCPGSVYMTDDAPAIDEGTAAHTAASVLAERPIILVGGPQTGISDRIRKEVKR